MYHLEVSAEEVDWHKHTHVVQLAIERGTTRDSTEIEQEDIEQIRC